MKLPQITGRRGVKETVNRVFLLPIVNIHAAWNFSVRIPTWGGGPSRTGPFCELTRISRNVVARLPLSFAIVVSKSAPSAKLTSQHIVWELACKSSGLQTLSVGSKSQIIGVKEQGRACGCSLAYMGKSFIPLAEQFPLAMAHRHNMVVSEHHSREDAEPALTDWSNENV